MPTLARYQLARDDPRSALAIFTVYEAARYLEVPNSTLHTWIRPDHGDPLVSSVLGDPYHPRLTFLGFAEAFVIASVRKAGLDAHRIQEGILAVRRDIGVEYALATHRLYHDRTELLIGPEGGVDLDNPDDLEVARNRQLQMTETVKSDLEHITYGSDGIAASLALPMYRVATVTIDPREAFGAPIIERTGTRIRDILSLRSAGEELRDIAGDFGLTVEEVQDVIGAPEKPASK